MGQSMGRGSDQFLLLLSLVLLSLVLLLLQSVGTLPTDWHGSVYGQRLGPVPPPSVPCPSVSCPPSPSVCGHPAHRLAWVSLWAEARTRSSSFCPLSFCPLSSFSFSLSAPCPQTGMGQSVGRGSDQFL